MSQELQSGIRVEFGTLHYIKFLPDDNVGPPSLNILTFLINVIQSETNETDNSHNCVLISYKH